MLASMFPLRSVPVHDVRSRIEMIVMSWKYDAARPVAESSSVADPDAAMSTAPAPEPSSSRVAVPVMTVCTVPDALSVRNAALVLTAFAVPVAVNDSAAEPALCGCALAGPAASVIEADPVTATDGAVAVAIRDRLAVPAAVASVDVEPIPFSCNDAAPVTATAAGTPTAESDRVATPAVWT